MHHLPFLYQDCMEQINRYNYFRQYPSVDPHILMKSASDYQKMFSDAQKITSKIAGSADFAKQVMEASQKNDKDKVKVLLNSLRLENPFAIAYSPEGLTVFLSAKNQCCELRMKIKWRQ